MTQTIAKRNTFDRRTFLTMTAASLLGVASETACQANQTTARGKIALQLYTVRREIEKDLNGTLERVARLGFKHVETAFWPE